MDSNKLETLITMVQAIIDSTIVTTDGTKVSEDNTWATKDQIDALKAALEKAKQVTSDFTQDEVDEALFELNCALEDFAASTGELEPIIRESSITQLEKYINSLDKSLYRDQELSDITNIYESAVTSINLSKDVDQISEIYVMARLNISDVMTAEEIIQAEKDATNKFNADKLVAAKVKAVNEIDAYKNKKSLYSTANQVTLLSLIMTYTNRINAATGIDNVNAQLKEGKVKIAALKTIAQTNTDKTKAFKKKKTTVKISKKTKKTVTASWKKIKDAKGYQVMYATNKKFTKGKKNITLKKASTLKKKIRKLKKNKKYYVRVRAYTKIGGKKVYSKWSTAKMAKTKKK